MLIKSRIYKLPKISDRKYHLTLQVYRGDIDLIWLDTDFTERFLQLRCILPLRLHRHGLITGRFQGTIFTTTNIFIHNLKTS